MDHYSMQPTWNNVGSLMKMAMWSKRTSAVHKLSIKRFVCDLFARCNQTRAAGFHEE